MKHETEIQPGVTVTIEVDDAIGMRILDNPDFPQDIVEVYDPYSGAVSRLEVQQNGAARGEL